MKKYWIIICFLLTVNLQAAGPVTHAVLANRWLSVEHVNESRSDHRQLFFLGAFFPDIQYLGERLREETHYFQVSLNDVTKETDPFLAGIKHHCFVDEIRENYVLEQQIYEYLKEVYKLPEENLTTFLKLVEDHLLFELVDQREILEALATISHLERQQGVSEETLKKWHQCLVYAFKTKPQHIIRASSFLKQRLFNVPASILTIWDKQFLAVTEDPFIQFYVKQLILLFDFEFAL